MPIAIITACISTIGLILGSMIGAITTYRVNKNSTKQTIMEQLNLYEKNRKYQEECKGYDLSINVSLVRLDMCTAIFQSLRSLKQSKDFSYFYVIPIAKDYHARVASLSSKLTLKELSYIYQFYGILEKLNKDILNITLNRDEEYLYIKDGYLDIVKKLYGENYKKILDKDIDTISYEELIKDTLMKDGYRNVFNKLNEICKIVDCEEEECEEGV